MNKKLKTHFACCTFLNMKIMVQGRNFKILLSNIILPYIGPKNYSEIIDQRIYKSVLPWKGKFYVAQYSHICIYKTIFLPVLTMTNLIHEYNTVPVMNVKNKCE